MQGFFVRIKVMIKKTQSDLVWYESERLRDLGIVHGFFGRVGGVSKPPFDSLNVKHQDKENLRAVDQNRLTICQTLGMSPRQLQFASLCHEDSIADCTSSEHGMTYIDIDSLITQRQGQPLMLSVADCVPVIIANQNNCAVVHVGWRGAKAGIIQKTIEQLVERGAAAKTLIAAIGPSIAKDSYEVGENVYAQFVETYPDAVHQSDGKYWLGVGEVVARQLQECGITSIDTSDVDVFSQNDEWFSARRGDAGRNAVIAAIKT